MHAALHGDPARYRALDDLLPENPSPTLYGRVAPKGLSDELAGKYYAIIETPDGTGYHVPLGNRAAEELRRGDLVAFSSAPPVAGGPPPPRSTRPRPAQSSARWACPSSSRSTTAARSGWTTWTRRPPLPTVSAPSSRSTSLAATRSSSPSGSTRWTPSASTPFES
jgi:hypothetical protein